jgi:hypothetical protein
VLGERVRTEGAPDSSLAVVYPPKLEQQPSWLTWDYKTYKDFKLWAWLQATKALDLPIGEKTETWYNYFSIQGNQIKAKELLDPFRKENKKQFDILLQDKYDLVYPTARCMSSIQYVVPDQEPFEDLQINTHIQDSRLIPITEAGDTIRMDFLKPYLEERLKEYLALVGLKEFFGQESSDFSQPEVTSTFLLGLVG